MYEVFANEFRYLSDEGLEEMRKSGRLQLNLKPIKSLDRKLKENDMLTSRYDLLFGLLTKSFFCNKQLDSAKRAMPGNFGKISDCFLIVK